MKKNELQQATDAELNTKLEDAYQEIFNLRFQRATGQVENTARIRQIRRDIARLKTAQSQQAAAK